MKLFKPYFKPYYFYVIALLTSLQVQAETWLFDFGPNTQTTELKHIQG